MSAATEADFWHYVSECAAAELQDEIDAVEGLESADDLVDALIRALVTMAVDFTNVTGVEVDLEITGRSATQ